MCLYFLISSSSSSCCWRRLQKEIKNISFFLALQCEGCSCWAELRLVERCVTLHCPSAVWTLKEDCGEGKKRKEKKIIMYRRRTDRRTEPSSERTDGWTTAGGVRDEWGLSWPSIRKDKTEEEEKKKSQQQQRIRIRES